MAASTINSVVKSTVTLGKDGYHPRLDSTATGAVLPTTYGADAIIDPATVHNGFITNHGTVAGRLGRPQGGHRRRHRHGFHQCRSPEKYRHDRRRNGRL